MQQSPCSGRHRSNQRSLHSRHHHRSRCQDVLHQNNSVVTVATTTITMPAVADDVDNAAVVVCSRLGFEPVQNLQSPTWERFCSDHPRVARAVPSASSSSPYLSSSSGSGHGATATCAGASSPPAGPRTSTTSAIGTRISPENHPPEPSTSTTTIPGDLLGRGIFNVDGNAWLFQRKMASLELGSVSVRSYALEIVSSEIQSRLIPLLASLAEDRNSAVDLQDLFRRFSFDNICKFSFGLDPGCLQLSLPISDFAVAFDTASKLSAERAMTSSPIVWKIKRFFNIGSERQLRDAVKMVDSLAKSMIEQRREMGNFSTQKDLLSRFMANIDDDKYLRDIVVSFLLAGRDTIASGLTSLFYLLSQHPEVKRAILEELDRVMGRSGSESRSWAASFEQMREMHYLHAVIYETMRLYPPIQFDSKYCQEDDVLPDGTFVPSGTRVTYHQYAMGRMERVWGSDCLEFKPERWLKNGLFTPECPFKYPVFQGGERVCLGKELALLEMKSVAVALVRRFDIQVSEPDRTPRFAPGLTATVRGGLPVRIQERKG